LNPSSADPATEEKKSVPLVFTFVSLGTAVSLARYSFLEDGLNDSYLHTSPLL
jgi:hypothetical protein